MTSPRIMTHLFADGGRIVRSTRTDYSEHLGRRDLADVVRGLMKEQHKAMFVALRGGELDELIGFESKAPAAAAAKADDAAPDSSVPETKSKPGSEGTAAKGSTGQGVLRNPESGVQRAVDADEPTYAAPRPATIFADAPVRESLFGETVMEKSLDETILSYLSEDAEAADGSG